MADKSKLTPLASAIGITFAASLAATPVALADENPFSVTEMSSGYMVAGADKDGKADKEGKCGEGKCGEGKCGGDKADKKDKADKEGKCGEGKCGGDKGGDE